MSSMHNSHFDVFVYVNIEYSCHVYTMFFFSQEGVTHVGPQEQFEEPQIGINNSLFSCSLI